MDDDWKKEMGKMFFTFICLCLFVSVCAKERTYEERKLTSVVENCVKNLFALVIQSKEEDWRGIKRRRIRERVKERDK